MFNTFLLNFIDDSLIIGHRHRELLRKPTRVRNICIQSIDYCIRIPLYISYRLRLVFVDSQTQLFYFPIETISKLHHLRRSPGTHFGVLLAHTSAFSWYTLRRSPGTHFGVLLAHTCPVALIKLFDHISKLILNYLTGVCVAGYNDP